MKCYRITLKGYQYYEVVAAETAQQAYEYLCWITERDDCDLLKAEETTTEIPVYWCPEGWTKPESVAQAQVRSLQTMLKNSGVEIKGWNGICSAKFSPELDAFFKSQGYYAAEECDCDDDIFGFVTERSIRYTKPGSKIGFSAYLD